MKKLLLLMVALFTLGGVTFSAKAQEKTYATFASPQTTPNTSWDADEHVFTWTSSSWNQLNNIGLPSGNITSYSKIGIDCEFITGTQFRILFYKGSDNKTIWVKKGGVSEFTLTEVIDDMSFLTGCTQISLSGDNVAANGSVKINSVYLVESDDPLAGQRKALQSNIDLAKMQSSFGKTSASFAVLTSAITAAETAYAATDATAASLEAATNALSDAINGLVLLPGYINLTSSMFKEWNSASAPTSGSPTGCAYDLNKETGQPYGDGSVSWVKYALLDDYDKLVVVAYSGTPRLCFNRLTADGQQAATKEDSKMIDINANNGTTWSTPEYQSKEGTVFTIDLTKIKDDYEYVHLNCIKNQWGPALIVTDMLLYKAPVQLASDAKLEGYKTFYNANNNYVVDDNTTIYTAIDKGSYIQLNEVEGKVIPAGTPVILKTTDTSYEMTVTITSATATIAAQNDLRVATGTETDKFVLAYTDADGLAFYQYENELAAGKVYVEASSAAKERLGIVVEGEATEITGVKAGAEKAPATFNIAGQRVGDDYKGIVIKNGKKVMVK